MTLKQLSEMTRLSVSLLSEIERGLAQPSMSSLKKISQAMGFSFFDFGDEENGRSGAVSPRAVGRADYISDVRVVREHQRKKLIDPSRSPYMYELLTPDFNRRMEVVLLRWEPGFSSGPDPIVDPPGEKFVVVLRGSVEFRIDDELIRLGEGDSIYYPSDKAVFFEVVGEEPCQAIGVATPPTF